MLQIGAAAVQPRAHVLAAQKIAHEAQRGSEHPPKHKSEPASASRAGPRAPGPGRSLGAGLISRNPGAGGRRGS